MKMDFLNMQNSHRPDTSQDAAQKQMEIFRTMDMNTKAEITFQLSENLRQIVIDGIRHRHPEYSQKQIVREILAMTLDKNLFDEVVAACGGRL